MGHKHVQYDQDAAPLQGSCQQCLDFQLLTADEWKMTLAWRANCNQNQCENLQLYPSEGNPSVDGLEDQPEFLPTVSILVEK